MNREWNNFAKAVKDKRRKKDINIKKDDAIKGKESEILNSKELIVQLLDSEPTGSCKKYQRVGAQEFVEFPEDDLSIESLKDACNRHFRERIPPGMTCDILASDILYIPLVSKCHI